MADDLDRLLTEAMHGAADRAPSAAGLLDAVHGRSRRYRHRRRIVTGVLASVALLAGGGTAAALASQRPAVPLGTPATSAAPSASPTPSTPVPASTAVAGANGSASPHPTATPVRLVATVPTTTFPYTLPPTNGMLAPVATLDDGALVAYFAATDQQHYADVTVTVTTRRPTFAAPAAGPVTETAEQVRGHSGTLRTVDVHPAAQLTLYWQESAGRWIQLATDDTFTPEQVVSMANTLTPAALPVPIPFRLDLAPADMVPDTITPSTVSFRPSGSPPGTGVFACTLLTRRPLPASNTTVGGYRALLAHTGGGVTLDVDVTDWSATLEITVASGYSISDADLLRFAAGVHILNRSEPTPR